MKNHALFAHKISSWGTTNNREMPWKGEKNPYLIWLSEIILQQTRVEQGLKYYIAFKKAFPSVFDLANAPQSKVLKLWEGLGYYSRARNLHFSAKYIVNECNGIFPNNYKDLLKLKGVGSYTAAAIASFAYQIPKAVVDGNVIRVLSRYFGIKNAFHSVKEKSSLQALADKLIEEQNPAIYNQAIMDFGATICTPKQVDCLPCFLKNTCYAFENNKQHELPLGRKKVKQKERFFTFFVFKHQHKTAIEERHANDIWRGLYQFPLVETRGSLLSNSKEVRAVLKEKYQTDDFEVETISAMYKQKLSHQKIRANFVEIKLKSLNNNIFLNTDTKNLSNFAFPKIINVYLDIKRKE